MALYVNKVSHETIKKLANKYLEPYTTMADVAKANNSSSGTISNILYRGVVECILDDITAAAVAEKAVAYAYDLHRTNNRWKRAMKERELNQANFDLEYFKQKQQELQFQYETFDDFATDEQGSPSKEELSKQLLYIENEIVCINNHIESLNNKE